MLSFNCPACHHYGEADNAMAGEIIGCANCLTHFPLPMVETPVEASEAPRISVQEPGKGAVVEAWARCRRCGARKTDRIRCTFCGFEFQAVDPIRIDRAERYRRQVAAQIGMVLAVASALFGLPALGYYLKTTHDNELRLCQESLTILHNAIRSSEGRPAGLPKMVGRSFLIAVAQKERIGLMCPSVDHNATRRAVDFRGPVRFWDELLPEDPVAADLEGNHRGITVLLKNGTVEYASKGSFLYRRALAETKE